MVDVFPVANYNYLNFLIIWVDVSNNAIISYTKFVLCSST